MDKIKSFSLYRHRGWFNSLVEKDGRVEIMYIKELPEEKTYFIKVDGDKIEDFLLESKLPEKLKQELREDVVEIVKGYNRLVEGKVYSEIMRHMCNNYFKTALEKFCVKHGSLYSYKEYDINEE